MGKENTEVREGGVEKGAGKGERKGKVRRGKEWGSKKKGDGADEDKMGWGWWTEGEGVGKQN